MRIWKHLRSREHLRTRKQLRTRSQPRLRKHLRRAVPVLALAVGLSAVPATAGAAPAKAEASSGWNNFNCRPSSSHPRPVVLVHGTFGNSVDNFVSLAPYLVDRGYCVFSFDYGQISGIPLFYGLGPIDQSAQQLSAFVDQVLAATGASKTDIVGHSQGGMMPRYYLKFLGGADKVGTLVGIGADNHGTTVDGLDSLIDQYPGAKQVLGALTPGLTDQLVGSAFLQKLNAGGDTVPGVHYTVIASKYDEVVTPYTSQFLSGPDVHNVTLQNLCPVDLSEHVAIGTVDRVVFHEAANALDPAHATATTCASAFS
jgi:triacylglycerol esterase/lipase EstA (alpha/beta hydrolase family)